MKPAENEILFMVKDTGIGIDKKDFGRLFEPFYQPEHTIYRTFSGTGLGLTICKGIVESQKGRIWVESELVKGSAFYFTVPFKPVKEITPVRLMFSGKWIMDNSVEELFREMLGPIGQNEFNDLKNDGKINKYDITRYIKDLHEKGIISTEKAEHFRKKAIFIFEQRNIATEAKIPK